MFLKIATIAAFLFLTPVLDAGNGNCSCAHNTTDITTGPIIMNQHNIALVVQPHNQEDQVMIQRNLQRAAWVERNRRAQQDMAVDRLFQREIQRDARLQQDAQRRARIDMYRPNNQQQPFHR